MSGTVNKVIIIGNVGKDPEIRTFPNGGRVANLSIATSESWKDKASGEKKERSEWHRVSVLNDPLINIVEKYVRKGSKLFLVGQLETRKYEKNGVDTYTTEIVLRPFSGEITLLDRKEREAGTYDLDEVGVSPRSAPDNDMDDEIPF